jgi:hypothetical protein
MTMPYPGRSGRFYIECEDRGDKHRRATQQALMEALREFQPVWDYDNFIHLVDGWLVIEVVPTPQGRARHLPGTKAQHDADFDFDHWLVGEYGESRHNETVSIEPWLRMAYRAGWEAHKEEMIQEAMSARFRE